MSHQLERFLKVLGGMVAIVVAIYFGKVLYVPDKPEPSEKELRELAFEACREAYAESVGGGARVTFGGRWEKSRTYRRTGMEATVQGEFTLTNGGDKSEKYAECKLEWTEDEWTVVSSRNASE